MIPYRNEEQTTDQQKQFTIEQMLTDSHSD